jgi:hypothetical protein
MAAAGVGHACKRTADAIASARSQAEFTAPVHVAICPGAAAVPDAGRTGGLGDCIARLVTAFIWKSDRSLREQSAVHGCSSVTAIMVLPGRHLEVRGGSNRHGACDLPEDVLALAPPASVTRVALAGSAFRHREDPDIVRAARERDIL